MPRFLRCPASPVDGDVLALGEGEESRDATFAAEAAFLDAAERCGGIGDEPTVGAAHPGLDPLVYSQATGQVSGVHVRDEAVLGVVGEGDRLVLGGERR